MSSNEYRDVRLQKSSAIRELGMNPYAVRTPERSTCAELRASFEAAERVAGASGQAPAAGSVKIEGAAAGRVLGIRVMGKAVFIDLWDESGKLQVYLNPKGVTETEWKAYEATDLGDFLWFSGEVQRTRTGEVTLFTRQLKFLTKSLAVPPLEKGGGLRDKETRYRKRYADLLASPETRADFALRSKIVTAIRAFLTAPSRGFMEVETPMMHPIPGGARARPFITHLNALNMDLYLRIAPELYLKRLLVGGFERVFEINRSFRNEGMDHSHNPEFTMLELYQAYSDYHGMMELTESLIVHLARMVTGKPEGERMVHTWGETQLDLTPPFRRVAYLDVFREHLGFDAHDKAKVAAKVKTLEKAEHISKLDHWTQVNELFDTFAQPKLINPTFLIDYPTILCPLAKQREDNPELCERFELFINGMEFANAFSELNDPVEQRSRFEAQVNEALRTKDEESPKEVDYDYVEALEFGMPPAGGLGVGIDRLCMLLANKHSIRDVVLFPAMRREQGAAEEAEPAGTQQGK